MNSIVQSNQIFHRLKHDPQNLKILSFLNEIQAAYLIKNTPYSFLPLRQFENNNHRYSSMNSTRCYISIFDRSKHDCLADKWF